jgi:hypothetical protein
LFEAMIKDLVQEEVKETQKKGLIKKTYERFGIGTNVVSIAIFIFTGSWFGS